MLASTSHTSLPKEKTTLTLGCMAAHDGHCCKNSLLLP